MLIVPFKKYSSETSYMTDDKYIIIPMNKCTKYQKNNDKYVIYNIKTIEKM